MLVLHALPTAPTLSHPTFATDAHRAPANVSRGHALHLTNASILFPGDEHPVSARELVLLVEGRRPRARRRGALLALRPAVPPILGQGASTVATTSYYSHGACMASCRPESGQLQHEGVCGRAACLCFSCVSGAKGAGTTAKAQTDPNRHCRRCYGVSPNCNAAGLPARQRCTEKKEAWSYRGLLESKGCCSSQLTVDAHADTDGGGHTVDRVAVVGSTASDDAGDWQGWEQFRCDDGESCAVGHQMASRQVLPWDKQGVRMEFQ